MEITNEVTNWFKEFVECDSSRIRKGANINNVTAKKKLFDDNFTRGMDFDTYIHEQIFYFDKYFLTRGMIFVYEGRPEIRVRYELLSKSYFLWYHYYALSEYNALKNIPQHVIIPFNFIKSDKSRMGIDTNSTGFEYLISIRPDLREIPTIIRNGDLLEWAMKYGANEHLIVKKILERAVLI